MKYTNVDTLFSALDRVGRHDLAQSIRMLKKNIILEEKKRRGQSRLDSFGN